MLHHHTNDPGERAWHIAEHEAQQVWETTGSYQLWYSAHKQIHKETLVELAGDETGQNLPAKPW